MDLNLKYCYLFCFSDMNLIFPKLQRNLSRKGSFRSGEKKTNSNAVTEKDTANSPRGNTFLFLLFYCSI